MVCTDCQSNCSEYSVVQMNHRVSKTALVQQIVTMIILKLIPWPSDKSAQLKIPFVISQSKHMLWVLIGPDKDNL